PPLDTRGQPGSLRARRFDDVPPLRRHRARGYLEGDQPIGLVLRELVAGLHPTPHEHAYEGVSGADTNRALGRSANFEQPALPERSIRVVAHVLEDVLLATVNDDALLCLDHRNPL